MGEVEVDRRHCDAPRVHGGQIGAGLVLKARVRAVDPVAASVLLLVLELELVAVDALAQAGHLYSSRLARGNVDIDQRAVRQLHLLDALDPARHEGRRHVEAEAAIETVVQRPRARLLRDGDRRQPQYHSLERRCDGARVGDVIAEVGAVVDAGDDQVGGEALDQAEAGEAHAVHGRAVGRVADAAVGERRLGDPQRPARGDRARHRRAVAVGRDHHEAHALERGQRATHRLQALGLDAVVVCQQHLEHCLFQDRGACGRAYA